MSLGVWLITRCRMQRIFGPWLLSIRTVTRKKMEAIWTAFALNQPKYLSTSPNCAAILNSDHTQRSHLSKVFRFCVKYPQRVGAFFCRCAPNTSCEWFQRSWTMMEEIPLENCRWVFFSLSPFFFLFKISSSFFLDFLSPSRLRLTTAQRKITITGSSLLKRNPWTADGG